MKIPIENFGSIIKILTEHWRKSNEKDNESFVFERSFDAFVHIYVAWNNVRVVH